MSIDGEKPPRIHTDENTYGHDLSCRISKSLSICACAVPFPLFFEADCGFYREDFLSRGRRILREFSIEARTPAISKSSPSDP